MIAIILFRNQFNVCIHIVVENYRGQLDFFLVYRKRGPIYDLCSLYPRKQDPSKSAEGMRLNCYPTTKLFPTVRIDSDRNDGLYIAEIEVHTFGIIFHSLAYYPRMC